MSRFNPPSDSRRRRSIRLRGYDYAQPGAYFVTIVVLGRACLFGDVVGAEMRLNDAGKMIRRVWQEIPGRFPGIAFDTFIVMPNHIHGIISIVQPVGAPLVGAQEAVPPHGATREIDHRATTRVAPTPNQEPAQPQGETRKIDPGATTRVTPTAAQESAPLGADTSGNDPRATTRVAPTGDRQYALGDVVGAFKSLTTVEYVRGVKTLRWPQFSGKLWQRNYFEHVVRSEESLTKIRQYIHDNPARWEFDKENPMAMPQAPEGL